MAVQRRSRRDSSGSWRSGGGQGRRGEMGSGALGGFVNGFSEEDAMIVVQESSGFI